MRTFFSCWANGDFNRGLTATNGGDEPGEKIPGFDNVAGGGVKDIGYTDRSLIGQDPVPSNMLKYFGAGDNAGVLSNHPATAASRIAISGELPGFMIVPVQTVESGYVSCLVSSEGGYELTGIPYLEGGLFKFAHKDDFVNFYKILRGMEPSDEVLSKIDFDTSVVLVAVRGECGSTGYSIAFDSVKADTTGKFIVTVKLGDPEGFEAMMITNPYHIVTVPKRVASA